MDFLERVRQGCTEQTSAPDGFYNASHPVRHIGDDILYFLLLICMTFRSQPMVPLRTLSAPPEQLLSLSIFYRGANHTITIEFKAQIRLYHYI